MEQFLLLYWVAIKVNLKFSSCWCRTEVDKKHTHYKRCRGVALSLHFRQGQNNFILFHAEIHIQCIIVGLQVCVRVCVHWNGHACWVASWLRTCWGEAALDEEGEETGRRRRDEGNENRCVLMCVCVCCRVCFFVRVRCCCFHCESMSSIINTARWPFPRGRSAVYLSDTISSYTQNPRADATATATRRQCRQRGNEIWIRIEWKLRAL